MSKYSREVEIPGRSAKELYETVSKDIDRFIAKSPIGGFEVIRNEANLSVSVKSSMANATLNCVENRIRLDANLSLFAAPFRGKLDDAIDRWLAKTFHV